MKKEDLKKISGRDLYFKGLEAVEKEQITIKQFISLCSAWLKIHKETNIKD